MDPLVIVLTVVAAILSLILIVVGVQTILVLQEVRRSLKRFNEVAEAIEGTITRTFTPLQNLGGMMQGLKAGMKMFESFAHFVKKQNDDAQE
jgi:hypothetical protein